MNARGGWYGSALQGASGHDRNEISRVLLEKGVDVNTQGGRYGRAL